MGLEFQQIPPWHPRVSPHFPDFPSPSHPAPLAAPEQRRNGIPALDWDSRSEINLVWAGRNSLAWQQRRTFRDGFGHSSCCTYRTIPSCPTAIAVVPSASIAWSSKCGRDDTILHALIETEACDLYTRYVRPRTILFTRLTITPIPVSNQPSYSFANDPPFARTQSALFLICERLHLSVLLRKEIIAMSHSQFVAPPPKVTDALISFPTPRILLVVLNRPKSLNCITAVCDHELASLFCWLDCEPSLRCGIITGTGRAFCAGADLKEWDNQNDKAESRPSPVGGFCGLSRRSGKKPMIAAVNGICFGGGCEMVVNTDIVIASEKAVFGLPEVKRGVVATAGALPRLVRTVGRQRAMEMALTGRPVDAREAERWGLVNKVVGSGGDGASSEVVAEAIRVAEIIAANSPDSVIVTREGVKMGWEGVGVEEGTRIIERDWFPKMDNGENMKEGLKAFVEKREPRWVPSKL